jgi:hypothetical protein
MRGAPQSLLSVIIDTTLRPPSHVHSSLIRADNRGKKCRSRLNGEMLSSTTSLRVGCEY